MGPLYPRVKSFFRKATRRQTSAQLAGDAASVCLLVLCQRDRARARQLNMSEPSYVTRHNEARCAHCATPTLVYDPELEADAATYAATCPTGHADSTARKGAGENLAWAGSSNPAQIAESDKTWAEGIGRWYAEVENYDFQTGSKIDDAGVVIGHFTQMAWQGTTAIGCAMNDKCSNKFSSGMSHNAIVCRYRPPGNYVGQFTKQVMPTIASGACAAAHASCTGVAGPPASFSTTPSTRGVSAARPNGGAIVGWLLLALVLLALGVTLAYGKRKGKLAGWAAKIKAFGRGRQAGTAERSPTPGDHSWFESAMNAVGTLFGGVPQEPPPPTQKTGFKWIQPFRKKRNNAARPAANAV